MKVSGKVNDYRRRIMRRITRNIGKSQDLKKLPNQKIEKILIIRPNHRLGNTLLLTPLVQEVTENFPNASITLLTRGQLAPVVFENYKSVKNHILLPKKPFDELLKYTGVWFKMLTRRYDLIINVTHYSSSGSLLTSITPAKYKISFNPKDGVNDFKALHSAHEVLVPLRQVMSNGRDFQLQDLPMLDLKLSNEELENGKILLDNYLSNSRTTIALFTYATGGKCYSKKWWSKFYKQLKIEFPENDIIEILPVENVSQIDFKAKTFYSKDIREIASVMANCRIFIGGDSGIMHLACASGVPTVGLFTGRLIKYRPYGNSNCAIDTNKGTLTNWMQTISSTLEMSNTNDIIKKAI